MVQGRINDILLLLATHGARADDGALAPETVGMLKDTARYLRLSHLLFWADVC